MSSSCQPGRASTVWDYLGEREMRCGSVSRGGGGGSNREVDKGNLPAAARPRALQTSHLNQELPVMVASWFPVRLSDSSNEL